MNDAEAKKIISALTNVVNIDAALSNFTNRSARAGKLWAQWGSKNGKAFPEGQAHMKLALGALSKMIKDAKLVRKDIDKLAKEASPTALAKYKTGKEYRDQVLRKRLASAKSFHQNSDKFVAEMAKVLDGFPFVTVQEGGVDEKATFGYVQDFQHYYAAMDKGLSSL